MVGSSAISTAGLHASAMAIITRCRMPPDNWCGYSSTRWAAAGMPTRSSISIARVRACPRVIFSWSTRASMICSPHVYTGFNAVIGSWKIIEISLPRIARICSLVSGTRSRPLNRIRPPTILPGGCGMSFSMERAVTLLPLPDSPTTASVSPGFTSYDTPSTALMTAVSVKKYVFRFSRHSKGSLMPSLR